MTSKYEVKGLTALLIVMLYFLVPIVGLRYGILLGFDKDIGIVSSIILVFTFYWLSIFFLYGKNK
jgi:hypothetical protein